MASPSPGDRLWRAKECPQPAEKRNVPICRLESTEEDGVGSGFAELELVAGIELGGTAGLDLNADARGPVYHHGSVGGRQVLDVPDILSIAPDMGMAGRDIVADVGNIALPRCQRADLDAFLTRLNPARGAHHVAVLHAQQSQRMRRRDLVLARDRRCAQRARRRRGAATGRTSAAARPTWNQGGRESKRHRERILRMHSSTSGR